MESLSLAILAEYAQIGAFVIALFIVLISVRTLRSTANQVAELVRTQRSETGPLLSLSFGWEPVTDSAAVTSSSLILGPKFFPYDMRRPFRPRRDRTSAWFIGEFDKDCQGHEIRCRVKNLQEHQAAFARNIFIELIGGWLLFKNEDDKVYKGFVHLHTNPFHLAPGEEKELAVIDALDFSTFHFLVRNVHYDDLWGHRGHAYIGDIGADFWPPGPRGSFRPFADVQPDYSVPLRWSPYYQQPVKLYLLRERIERCLNNISKSLMKLTSPLRRLTGRLVAIVRRQSQSASSPTEERRHLWRFWVRLLPPKGK